MARAEVAVLRTAADRVLEDYERLLHLAEYEKFISKDDETLLKLNLSWTKYFPSCSSEPWQLEGVVRTLVQDGFSKEKIVAVENKTVVTDPWKGAAGNKWLPVLSKYGVPFVPLTEVEWVKYEFKEKLLRLDRIFQKRSRYRGCSSGKMSSIYPRLRRTGIRRRPALSRTRSAGCSKRFDTTRTSTYTRYWSI